MGTILQLESVEYKKKTRNVGLCWAMFLGKFYRKFNPIYAWSRCTARNFFKQAPYQKYFIVTADTL